MKLLNPNFIRAKPFLRRLLATFVVANVAVIAIVWFSVQQSRQNYEDRAKSAAENLSQLLSQNISGIFQRGDLGLLATTDEIGRQAIHGGISDHAINDFITRQHQRLPEFNSLRIADEYGIIRYGSGIPSGNGISVADRDYFVRLRDDPTAGLVISKPLLGHIGGEWAIIVGRRVSKPDGSFGGVAYLGFRASQLANMFKDLTLGPKGVVSVRDLDLRMVARYPLPATPNGEVGNQTVSPDFREHLRLDPDHGSYIAPTGMDNINRTVSYRRMTNYPAYIIVGLASDDYLGEWRNEAQKLVLIAVLFFLATLVMGVLIWKSWKRQEISEARLRSFFNATPDALLICDAKGMITVVNHQVARLLGYTADELVGQSIEILVPDRSRTHHPALRTMFAASPISRRMGRDLPVSVRHKDGSEVDVEISLGRIETGQGLFFACGLRDITERKKVQEALRESESRHRSALSALSEGVIIQGAKGEILDANNSATSILGLSIDQLKGRSSIDPRWQAIHEDGSPWPGETHPAMATLETGKAISNVIMGIHRPDGSLSWITINSAPIVAAEEELPHAVVSSFVDITHARKAEEDLRVAAVAFESQEGVMITDANSVILRVNRAFTTITGYTAEEAVGQTPLMLHSGRHTTEFYREMWEIINRTGGWQGEVWDRRKNGEVYPKWMTISVVKDDSGTVTHYVGAQFDISERKKSEERINELAFFDQLTGLPNRILLVDRLKQTMTATGRSDSYGALLFIGLDNFKGLNDTLGQEVGDLLLKQVAERLTRCVREGDTVARLGGDEFVVILTNLGKGETEAATGTETAAEKILATLNQIYRFGDAAHHSTASIGAALFKGPPMSIDSLMKQANLTLYKAKEAGRNTLRFFDPAMEVAVKARAALENDLRQAVETREFVLHYQAQVAGGQVTGAEVLVRWKHAQRGMVSPTEFIPLAEETGLILPLGHWVLETACTRLAVWATQPAMAHFTLAVNVSALQFNQPGFVDQVLEVLGSTGANPRRLKLELTESMLADNVQDIIEKMFALKAKGVGFSLDDFGTGYSSLSYLKRLPLDQLKIDQSFVRDIMVDANDAAIAKTVVALAQSLGLGVIAEGVETEAQRDFLASSGCHAYQGYFFSRPLPLEDFEQFARQA
jgi:diguanylate cyclase (GGDEF)-like protein/PAS domain S-box-containing protein